MVFEIDTSCSPIKLTVYQLVFHHGGVIVESPTLAYVNGQTKVIEWHDPEKLCVWTLLSLAASIGYHANSIKRRRFCPPGVSLDEGLKLVFDDDSVALLCKHLEEDEKLVNIYVEHGDSVITGEVPLPAGFNEPVEVVAGVGDEHGGSGDEMNDVDHSSSEEDAARVVEQNEEEEEEEIALVNVDLDSDGGEDPEIVSALNKVKKALEKEQQKRKELEELERNEFHEIPVQQR
ncbi:hypothetical protein CCACVL1_25725 [Corchorus capsularis]|uniref:PB1-like domain-containing protein n=1 Tax=Corchorus capsularis TaxID=210143 RepID=A0A1R3GHU2_COCAP|nr:hypothetical protein CCACVL1_25725 [Corchorus capsularis]